tara:strand:+ start:187 stop:558 length:372 start_codon:yes stop_codon:yes gene_type:complete
MTSEENKRIDELEDTLVAHIVVQRNVISGLVEKNNLMHEQVNYLKELVEDYRYQNDYGLNEPQAKAIHQVLEGVGLTREKFKKWGRPDQIIRTQQEQREYDEADAKTLIRGQANPYVAVEPNN